MIELRDTVAIEAGPREVWGWLEALPDHYRQWHPDHLEAEEGQNLRVLMKRRDP